MFSSFDLDSIELQLYQRRYIVKGYVAEKLIKQSLFEQRLSNSSMCINVSTNYRHIFCKKFVYNK